MKMKPHIVLPSNKVVFTDGLVNVTEVILIDYPDVFTDFYYTFDVVYDNTKISLFYLTKPQAIIDQKYVKDFLEICE